MQTPKKLIKVKPIIAIVCEQLRQEINGNPFITGIYMGGITVERHPGIPETQPVILPLSLWIPFKTSKAGEVSVEIHVVGPDPKRELNIDAKAMFEKAPPSYEILSFNFISIPIVIDREGDLKILFRNKGDKNWETLRVIPISIKLQNSNPANSSAIIELSS